MAARRVLIVESDQRFARDVAAALEPYGFQSEAVPDGAAALARIEAARPDLVVLSVELDGPVNGYAVCNKLKRDEVTRDIPVVLTSATATEDAFEQHSQLRTGADAYVLRDARFSIAWFLAVVDTVVPLGAPQVGRGGDRNTQLEA